VSRVFEGDPQARVRDRDRDRAVYVIEAALRNGQVTQQDRDLRVERVKASQTIGELEVLTRDLVATGVPVPLTAVVPPPADPIRPTGIATASDPYAGVPKDLYGPPPSPPKTVVGGTGRATKPNQTGRKLALGCALIAAFFFIVPIAAGVIIFAASSSTPDFVDTDPVPAGPPFELTGAGLRAYLMAFEETFEDTEVVRTVFYDGYVVSWVLEDDGRVAIWNYANGAFDQLGDPMEGSAVDTAPVDLLDLRPAKVMSLVRTAGSTLGVAAPATTYVIYDRDVIGGTPQLMVFVSNQDGRSGYLIGDLDGNVLQTSAAS
jgi:Domain of unknown function (DUF1707)